MNTLLIKFQDHVFICNISFLSISLQSLHLITCELPFDFKDNHAYGNFVAQESSPNTILGPHKL